MDVIRGNKRCQTVLLAVACTAEKNAPSSLNAELNTGSSKTSTANVLCGADEVGAFDRNDGETIDLSLDGLPRGLYLARYSELLIEKKSDAGVARAIVREAAGGKSTGGQSAEFACADGLEKIAPEAIDIALTGLVKFDTSEKQAGSSITQRQFFFFQDKTGFGAVISNPKPLAGQVDLKKLFVAQPANVQMVRMPDHTYVLKYQRERDGVRARLQVHLDLVQ